MTSSSARDVKLPNVASAQYFGTTGGSTEYPAAWRNATKENTNTTINCPWSMNYHWCLDFTRDTLTNDSRNQWIFSQTSVINP